MINKLIVDQLHKVELANLANFDEATNSYFIPQRKDIKIEENKSYLIHLKISAFTNTTVRDNWNGGKTPPVPYLKVNVLSNMGKMIKVMAVGFDITTQKELNKYWGGWLAVTDLDILAEI